MTGARVGTGDDDNVDDAGEEDDKDEFMVLASLLLCFISCRRETEERMIGNKVTELITHESACF